MKKCLKDYVVKFASNFGYEIRDKYSNVVFNYRNVARTLFLKRCFDRICDIDGDIVECGVKNGGTLSMFGMLVKEEGKKRQIYGFDSFAGYPPPSIEDKSTEKLRTKMRIIERNIKKKRNYCPIERTRKFLLHTLTDAKGNSDVKFINSRITLVKGFFEDTLHKHTSKIALLHLNCDLYMSYKVALEALYPKVLKGGVVILSEYEYWPGARKAVDDYFSKVKKTHSGLLIDEAYYRTHYIIKA